MTDQQTIKFGDICREVKLTTKDPIADGYERYIGLEHLDSGSLKIKRWGMIAEDNPSFTRVFKKGHILFGKRRPYLKKAAIAEFDGICSGDIVVIEPLGKAKNSSILPLILQTEQFWSWAVKTSTGSLSPRTKYKELSNFEIPSQDSSNIRRLLNAFDLAQRSLNLTNESLDSLNTLFHCFLLSSLSPKAHWDSARLTDLGEVKGGRQRAPQHMDGEDIVQYLRPANIKRGKINIEDVLEMNFTPAEQDVYMLQSGDILLVEGGEAEDVGDSAYFNLTGKYCFQNTLIRVRAYPERINPRHLYWLLSFVHRSGGFLGIAAGTKIKHIGTKNTSGLSVSVPPKSELNKICSALDVFESTLMALELKKKQVALVGRNLSSKIFN
ncbi:restriction endonuclease subunit S [Citrobacter freundii]|uniref:restriction endonuclease subunit S n=1 Tax=Enterobacteriaceae TaxID=543 RepID=UPI001905FE53|nr:MULTISPECIES: restriction endonuclease subunit S [Enterobacteriaceae]EKV5093793.1 restriction endonuclease subunit S [Citrobacter freundii]MBJ9241114.1 restriction endonuclease subunit S [Citrobacter braakii]MDC7314243.1 restriction endonuclease subunit S [Enterobacter ludwigii]MDI0400891.1 restriction endonuclease subunit S [Enterobacter ludwigii]MDI0412474.1 restriction endonuclease subunit S [Enterobacter ludwigii]